MLSYESQPPAVPCAHLTAAPPSSLGVMHNGSSNLPAAVLSNTHKHIWIITGPAGCGKSTIAQHLSQQLSLPYIEGDEVSKPLPCILEPAA